MIQIRQITKTAAIAALSMVIAAALGTQDETPATKTAGSYAYMWKMRQLQARAIASGGSMPGTDLPDTKKAISDVASDPEATMIAVGVITDNYFQAKTEIQATQAASEYSAQLQSIQVAQNAKIIALLTQIAQKK